MSEDFKFEPKPPHEMKVPETWQDLLEVALKKAGVEGNSTLEGYWDNEVEKSNEDPTGHSREAMTQDAIDAFICNLQDMSKEDAMITLVNLYAAPIL